MVSLRAAGGSRHPVLRAGPSRVGSAGGQPERAFAGAGWRYCGKASLGTRPGVTALPHNFEIADYRSSVSLRCVVQGGALTACTPLDEIPGAPSEPSISVPSARNRIRACIGRSPSCTRSHGCACSTPQTHGHSRERSHCCAKQREVRRSARKRPVRLTSLHRRFLSISADAKTSSCDSAWRIVPIHPMS